MRFLFSEKLLDDIPNVLKTEKSFAKKLLIAIYFL